MVWFIPVKALNTTLLPTLAFPTSASVASAGLLAAAGRFEEEGAEGRGE